MSSGVPLGELAWLAAAIVAGGVLAGFLAGLFGIGGGAIIVPVLYEVFRVIGVPDERWGERVHAIVVPKPGAKLTAEAVLEHCRGQIAGYKCPRSVDFRDAPLPLSGAGKVLKRELRDSWQGSGQNQPSS